MEDKSRYYPNEFNWWELPEKCSRCTMPLHLKSGQDFPFCPNCAADKMNAERGRIALKNLKERIAAEKAAALLAETKAKEDADRAFWPEGMAM